MATKTPVRPGPERRAARGDHGLLQGSDTVELKLTIPAAQQRTRSARSISMRWTDPASRSSTPLRPGARPRGRCRARAAGSRAHGRLGDQAAPARPRPGRQGRPVSSGFGVEVDAIPGGFVCSGRLKCEADSTTSGRWCSASVAGQGLHQGAAGPVPGPRSGRDSARRPRVLRADLRPQAQVAAWRPRAQWSRRWLYPDGARVFELSTKCLPGEAFGVAAEARAYLSEHGIDLSGEQQTKTRTALGSSRPSRRPAGPSRRAAVRITPNPPTGRRSRRSTRAWRVGWTSRRRSRDRLSARRRRPRLEPAFYPRSSARSCQPVAMDGAPRTTTAVPVTVAVTSSSPGEAAKPPMGGFR